MSDRPTRQGLPLWVRFLAGGFVLAALILGIEYFTRPDQARPVPLTTTVTAATEAEVHNFCAYCHKFPPPDSFPRANWKQEVNRGFGFFEAFDHKIDKVPSEAAVLRYYQDRAPHTLPPIKVEEADTPPPAQFTKINWPPVANDSQEPFLSHISFVHLSDPKRKEVLATEMNRNQILALKPWEEHPRWRVLAGWPDPEHREVIKNPGHAEVVDLDGDGIQDIVVANLGNFSPTDSLCGSVVWLRGLSDGTYEPHTLLRDVGRVADVQFADFRGTGQLDLIVAVFGWYRAGNVLLLENHTRDWKKPDFRPHVVDDRHGAIHVPVGDLNGDQKPDFIALISQEHETIVAFLNQGDGTFQKETIYQAPHPAYGSSGIELVDLNGDGAQDVLYTNGDVMDNPGLLKPYHSVQWLENPGKGKFPWIHHHLTSMYGVHRAVAGELNGDGKMHIVAVAFLPEEAFPQRTSLNLDSVILLEQVAPGKFVRHSLEKRTCDQVSCVLGDVFGTGRLDILIGGFARPARSPGATLWHNEGKPNSPD